ncbi:hypothetical protein [Rickettsiales endosymbiont of Stachyamoeba lipophora]|uniref:hypothetical protein n=1 Tax=Rickettsiales endosymbiont of Stachyamoeba lipophora TaxID=2486578 RepID=UPI000F64DCF9|nr:hypothetical protein EF513_06240 [Rickettsiales endosymbiont of Stachyamoeba lipophora]
MGAFIRNPLQELIRHKDAKNIIETRTNLFARNLNLEASRIKDWSYVQALLAVCWMIEDEQDPKPYLKLVEIMA